jgi:hypothetical protein
MWHGATGEEAMTNERLRQSIEQLTKDTSVEWQSGYDAGMKRYIISSGKAFKCRIVKGIKFITRLV